MQPKDIWFIAGVLLLIFAGFFGGGITWNRSADPRPSGWSIAVGLNLGWLGLACWAISTRV